jgi:lysozyme family protein
MVDHFAEAWRRTGRIEGGYSNHQNDPGGETNHGITQKVARAWGYKGEMRKLDQDTARKIARLEYWEGPRFHLIAEIAPAIAYELFDTHLNMWPGFAAESLQRLLNGFNRRTADYPDLLIDGHIGTVTASALRLFLTKRGIMGEAVLLAMLNALQGAEYLRQVEVNEKKEDFFFGWASNRVTMRS